MMKLKFLAAGVAPDYYTINGDVVTAHIGDETDVYDFSGIPNEPGVITVEPESNVRAIRKAKINDQGELELTLCQKVGAGHWTESDWINAADYDPTARYVKFVEGKQFAGVATYVTKDGVQTYGGNA